VLEWGELWDSPQESDVLWSLTRDAILTVVLLLRASERVVRVRLRSRIEARLLDLGSGGPACLQKMNPGVIG
jgi:hypothetical protein